MSKAEHCACISLIQNQSLNDLRFLKDLLRSVFFFGLLDLHLFLPRSGAAQGSAILGISQEQDLNYIKLASIFRLADIRLSPKTRLSSQHR